MTTEGAALLARLSAEEVAALEALRWMVESVAGVRAPVPPPATSPPRYGQRPVQHLR